MGHEQEIAFTFEGGVLRPDQILNLPDGARGIATIRQVSASVSGQPHVAVIAAIRRIGEAGVLNSGGCRLSRDEMHERD